MRSWLVSFLHLLFCSPHSFLPPAPIICLTQHCLLVVLSPDYLSRLFSNCFHSFSRLRPTSLKLSTFDRPSDNLVQPCTWTGFVGKTIRNLLCISERPDRRDSQSLDREICRDRYRLACPDHHSTQKQHTLQCTIIQYKVYEYINTRYDMQIHIYKHTIL